MSSGRSGEPVYDWGTTRRFVGADRLALDIVLDVNEEVVRAAVAGAAIEEPVAAIGLQINDETDEPTVLMVSVETEAARLSRARPPLDIWGLRAVWDGFNYALEIPVQYERFADPGFVAAKTAVDEAIGDLEGLDRSRVALVELVQRLIDSPPPARVTEGFVVFLAGQINDDFFSLVRHVLPDATRQKLEQAGYLPDEWPHEPPL